METRTEMGYGFFCGGDPRKFYPDCESCSEKEIENHKAACKLWDEADARGVSERVGVRRGRQTDGNYILDSSPDSPTRAKD